MQQPLFTVIISTYNRKDILPRAIESVLNQTFPNFELLVIDNGSTDSTASVCDRVKDDRFTYVRNPKPTDSCDGPRNLGIEMAQGNLIAFLDDDDIWYPTRLEKVKKAFEENPDVSCVCHNENKNVDGKITETFRYGPWSPDLYERLLYEGNCLSSCATTIKRDLLKKLDGFDLRKEFCKAADYDLWIRMAKRGVKIYFIDEPLGEFFLTGHNWSTADPTFRGKLANLLEMHILQHEKKPILQISKRGMWQLFKLNAIAGKRYTKAGDYRNALRHYRKAALFVMKKPSLISTLFSGTVKND
ncbi:MAG: glycosyltransferase [Candidatus Omnitrophica bacterium]|nr:glycosyltransferase [Candidatus Omnitrophota bacterium]